ncbi:MAG: primosomal protein N', partial [Acidovorax sp. 17-64-282]
MHTPSHSGVGDLLSYASERPLAPGTLVRVPLGNREVLGVVWDADQATGELPDGATLRAIAGVLEGVAPLDLSWRRLVAFAARYYQRALGEVALAALPPQLRDLKPEQLARRLRRPATAAGDTSKTIKNIALTAEQESARARIAAEKGPFLKSWLAAHSGSARIVLGTRMAVFASLPGLQLIVVDEEHDPSYKQQEGARYSARDLAIWRGREQGAKVLLGSATPSLESWHASRPPTPEDPEGGRYVRLHMPSRIGAGALARVRRVDMNQQPRRTVFSAPLLAAITERVARGEQSMVLLNRRGYAPVLHCADCGWKSDCPHCSAHQVFHKTDRTMRCHHCGFTVRVPYHCPTCGSPDIQPMGRGTEQLEEQLSALLRNVQRPDGDPARIARIDADTTKAKGALEAQLAQVHSGEVDVLV